MKCNATLAARALAVGTGLSAAISLVTGCSGGKAKTPDEDGIEQPNETNETSQVSSELFADSNKTWADPHINVCWESVPSPDDRAIIRDAIRKSWEIESNVTFLNWGICAAGATGLRIRSMNSALALNGQGNTLNGVVNGVTIPNWSTGTCFPGWTRERCVKAAAVRAFGHALGFAAEQNRQDNMGCFAKLGPGQTGNSWINVHDGRSVMSDCNPFYYGDGILSATDIQGVQQMYGGPRSISVASWGTGRLDAFVRGMDGGLYQRWFDGTNWNGYGTLFGNLSGPPNVISTAPNRLDIFARGLDGSLQHIAWTGAGWTQWESLGGNIIGTPRAVSWGPNRLDVFARGHDRTVRHIAWDGFAWRAWESLGGDINGDVEAAARTTNRLDVFARNAANQNIMHSTWDGSTWSAFTSMGPFESLPEAVSLNSGRVDLFARNLNKEYMTNTWNGSTWAGWQNFGGPYTSHPTPVVRGTFMDLFGRGMDGNIYVKTYNGTTWSTWALVATKYTRGTPAAVAWSGNRLDLFVKINDDSMQQTSWTSPGPWAPFWPLGGTFK